MPKNKHAQALGRRGGSVSGGAKADASRKNLAKVSPASRIANAKKARAARAAKRLDTDLAGNARVRCGFGDCGKLAYSKNPRLCWEHWTERIAKRKGE